MSDETYDPRRCAAIADDLALLALGTLSGPDRSAVLEHVDTCLRCRTELEQLTLVAETLQQLTPQVQPPLGFESRLAERLQGVTVPRRRPRRYAVLAAAAAVVLLAFGLGVVVAHVRGNSDHGTSAAQPLTADLTAGTDVVGTVVVSPGSPGWLLMTVEGGRWQGKVTCEVTLADGSVATIGSFTLSGEYPSWAAPLPATGGAVRWARLVDASGATLASAQLEAWTAG
jgi:hypothetical protein